MPTHCNREFLEFHPSGQREVRGQFDGGEMTTDAGGLLLREVEKRTGIVARLAACFTDHREAERVEHGVKELVGQRVYPYKRGTGVRGSEPARGRRGDEKGANPRFVVTSLSAEAWEARRLYEERYCARGEMDNRIKEQLMLLADQTSTAYLRSNQIRLYFSSVAYVLMEALRRLGLKGMELAQAVAAATATLRLKLLKIGALS